MHSPDPVRLYPWRWFMLAVFSLLSFSNSLMWITFAPVATLCKQFWDVSDFAINSLSLVYEVVFIPGAFFASYIVDHQSLRAGLTWGAILNVVGALWRVLPYPFLHIPGSHPYSFPAAVVGQTLLAAAQTFILAMPPKLAQNWFGERERVTATAIGALFNQLGVAIGFVLGPQLMNNVPGNLPFLMGVEALIAIGVAALVLIGFRSRPATPPSVSADKQQTDTVMSLGSSLKALMTNLSFIILLVSFGIAIGAFYAVSTILDFVVSALGYSQDDTSLFGLLIVAVGIGGAIICGVLADKTRKYKWICVVGLFGSAGSLVWFTLASVPNNRMVLAACCSVMGFFMTALLPVGMDLSVEITYPVPEAISSSLLLASAQVFGIVFTIGMTALQSVSVAAASWLLTGFVGLAAVLMLFFRGVNKRLDAEVVHEEVKHLINS